MVQGVRLPIMRILNLLYIVYIGNPRFMGTSHCHARAQVLHDPNLAFLRAIVIARMSYSV